MKDITVFDFHSSSIRVVMDELGEPWFVAKDVANALGAESGGQVARMVDDEDKRGDKISTPGGIQELICLNESGLYTAIIRSHSKNAKPFRKWVTMEVLPSIRKTGQYAPRPMSTLEILELQLKLHKELETKQKQLEAEQALPIDRVKDQRFGLVNSYHESILDACIAEILSGN